MAAKTHGTVPGRAAGRAAGRRAAACLGSAVLLLATGPAPAQLWRDVTDPGPDPVAPLVAVVTGAAWLLTAWLLVVVSVVAATAAPGAVGAAAARAARWLAPRAVRRAVQVALGLTVAYGSLAAPASAGEPWSSSSSPARASGPWSAAASPAGPARAAAPEDQAPGTVDGAATHPPSLDWGTPPEPLPLPGAGPPPASAPADAGPVRSPAAVHADAGPTASPAAAPGADRTAPARSHVADRSRARSHGASAPRVVVRRGDTLWDIAARHLAGSTGTAPSAAQVAAAWPTWWSANRDVIGADPDLILPGTALLPPAAPATPQR